ncbi:energy-coupling factor transporter ATPase [Thermoclostridium stercorarium subsp. thermolacticum DSM 2910]|jgi:energy-coupling factor transporter ATPase|uniref:Energy-coupling factor transporter ATP-binding protein EcfA2 n=2 Tax=Thermoclostridium stercorarium TaxID=1510 RepID=A0A1B1YNS3_THEST|nr:energy-coupling factor transporter ATPase [Thermoclostridium stercorarium]ANW99794.1 energy-coupling factor transporter ATPase [Thermoclostridium stercorarium subsp. thermolacticum DSM 2910]ANX02421.1 energy-coupling factor transporter ATPase [Thermoclostridium stercorarium subsp. leptospartum DSM 9219]UZQ85504.1 energy-coupling factor transporter ATPase [Thermoclostridium stercorarium]
MEAIVAKDLEHVYLSRGGNEPARALNNISFSINEGEFVAIVGRNGSGKSTLAKHLNALLLPTGGTVCVFGKYTNAEDLIWEIRSQVGMVFQNPDNQIVATTVEEDVAFGPENLGVAPEEIRKRVNESLEKVNMLKYIHHSPHMLSGGQKQRVAIAGVLAMNPKCLVLDEATSMLDPTGRRDVIRILQKLNREDGITVILITHHMDEAAHADRVMVINRGSLVLEGTPREVFANSEILKKAGLDIPEVTSLYIRAVNEGIVKGGEIPVLMDELEKVLLKLDFVDSRKQERTHESPDGITESREKIIEIKNLSYVYMPGTPYERKALDNVSLDVYRGEILGIIGQTGSGKSTLIQHLNGLLTPTEGSINVAGIVPKGKALKELRRRVGLIFQNPEDQLFEETVEKDIAFGLKKMGLPDEEIEKRVIEAAEITGLPKEVLGRSPFELSGGQKRRVAIAGVIAMNPEILVLDEPTAGLDPAGSTEMYQFLLKLRKEKNTTIIVVSHTMEHVAYYCDRVAVMNHGKLVLAGKTREVFSKREFLAEMGLDVPQITEIFYRLNKKFPFVRKDILTVEEGIEELKRVLKK